MIPVLDAGGGRAAGAVEVAHWPVLFTGRPPRGHGVLVSSLRLPYDFPRPRVHYQSGRREVRTLSPRAPSKANTQLRGRMML